MTRELLIIINYYYYLELVRNGLFFPMENFDENNVFLAKNWNIFIWKCHCIASWALCWGTSRSHSPLWVRVGSLVKLFPMMHHRVRSWWRGEGCIMGVPGHGAPWDMWISWRVWPIEETWGNWTTTPIRHCGNIAKSKYSGVWLFSV